MDWTDKEVVREYKRLQQRKYRASTRTQTRRNIDWSDALQVNTYKRNYYREHSVWGRWREIVFRFLGPLPAVKDGHRKGITQP